MGGADLWGEHVFLSDKPGRNKVLVTHWLKPPVNIMVPKKEGAGKKTVGEE